MRTLNSFVENQWKNKGIVSMIRQSVTNVSIFSFKIKVRDNMKVLF
jgi:hypothetical protein